jgi:hypothetical protein
MKKKLMLLSTAIVILATNSEAQQKKVKKYHFVSTVSTGVLEGEAGPALQVLASAGLGNKNWSLAAGAGIDYYRIRSVPIFISAKRNLGPGSAGFFLQADAGINPVWFQPEVTRFDNVVWRDFKPGFYWQGLVGYGLKLGTHKNQLQFGLGYSYKRVKEIRDVSVVCISPPCNPVREEYDSYLRRLNFRIAWQLIN